MRSKNEWNASHTRKCNTHTPPNLTAEHYIMCSHKRYREEQMRQRQKNIDRTVKACPNTTDDDDESMDVLHLFLHYRYYWEYWCL